MLLAGHRTSTSAIRHVVAKPDVLLFEWRRAERTAATGSGRTMCHGFELASTVTLCARRPTDYS